MAMDPMAFANGSDGIPNGSDVIPNGSDGFSQRIRWVFQKQQIFRLTFALLVRDFFHFMACNSAEIATCRYDCTDV